MNCPVCDERLRTVDKHGVEVDICPGCKGVWLDRGELEKIIEMVSSGYSSTPSPQRQEQQRFESKHDDHHDRESHQNRDIDPKTGRPRKKGSWLGEIFDSFGGD
jgi:Zn-finger nucleic acid-binding protein